MMSVLGKLVRDKTFNVDENCKQLLEAAWKSLNEMSDLVTKRVKSSSRWTGKMYNFLTTGTYAKEQSEAENQLNKAFEALSFYVQVNTREQVHQVLRVVQILPKMDQKLDKMMAGQEKMDRKLDEIQKQLANFQNLSPAQDPRFRALAQQADLNGDGIVTDEEIMKFSRMAAVAKAADVDCDGVISEQEMAARYGDLHRKSGAFGGNVKMSNTEASDFWNTYFMGRDNVPCGHFVEALKEEFSYDDQSLEVIRSYMDLNGDGFISIDEFNLKTAKAGVEATCLKALEGRSNMNQGAVPTEVLPPSLSRSLPPSLPLPISPCPALPPSLPSSITPSCIHMYMDGWIIRMYACVYVCMFIHTHTYVFVCVCVYYIYINIYIHIYIRILRYHGHDRQIINVQACHDVLQWLHICKLHQ
jgi:hypothetical protein